MHSQNDSGTKCTPVSAQARKHTKSTKNMCTNTSPTCTESNVGTRTDIRNALGTFAISVFLTGYKTNCFSHKVVPSVLWTHSSLMAAKVSENIFITTWIWKPNRWSAGTKSPIFTHIHIDFTLTLFGRPLFHCFFSPTVSDKLMSPGE